MARLQCRGCGFDERITWDGHLVCPRCESTKCRVAVERAEMIDSEWDRIVSAIRRSSPDTDINE